MGELRGQKGRVWSIFILSGHLWSKMTSFFLKSIIPLLNYISRYSHGFCQISFYLAHPVLH